MDIAENTGLIPKILGPLTIGVIALIIAIKIVFYEMTHKTCTSPDRMSGKVVIVTGSNSGIGYATAVGLARRGAKVILACRCRKKGMDAVDKILKEDPFANVTAKTLNLASFNSVLSFAKDILKHERRLDVLINNAGTGVLDNALTRDGLPVEAQVNYFSHFLLTILLLPLLKSSAPSRIINVSSVMHRFGTVKNLNKQGRSFLERRRVYSNTKLANILFTRKLSQHLKNTGVTVNCLHPGAVYTNMFRDQPRIIKYILSLLFMSPEDGAQTSIYLATAKELTKVTGKYFYNCAEITPAKSAQDDEAAEKLWKMSQDITFKIRKTR